MKKKKWLEGLQYADDRYIEEADPNAVVKGNKRSYRTMITVAACVCLFATLLGVFVIAPYFKKDSVVRYRDSEYYTLIQKLNVLKKEQDLNHGYKGEGFSEMDGVLPPGGAMEDGVDDEKYEEITDNQVDGVVEGDLIKRSDRYAYYLTPGALYVYSIAKEDSERVGKYKLSNYEGFSEMYLSKDCKYITIMMSKYDYDMGKNTLHVLRLDVSDPGDIKKVNSVKICGEYQSSRMVNDDFLVMTRYNVVLKEVDYDDASTYVPMIEGDDGKKLISPDRILMPDKLSDAQYTVVARLNGDTLQVQDSAAFLSYTQDLYVSDENIFATRSYCETKRDKSLVTTITYTDISCISYAEEKFMVAGNVYLEGYVNDRYSLDEKDGVLRVVTTTQINQQREYKNGDSVSTSDFYSTTNASLYCVDVSEMKVVSKVEEFAPQGETVRSVRYEGDVAYVCTAVQITDPVFFFDLSDIGNITYKETEPIDGFSTSLVDFKNGYLMGIGRSDWSTFKVEIYKEGLSDVESVCKYELANTGYSTDYKAYYIDRENQLIGLGVEEYRSGHCYYIVLHFDENSLKELVKIPLKSDPTEQRGFFKDGVFYMFGDSEFKMEKITLA